MTWLHLVTTSGSLIVFGLAMIGIGHHCGIWPHLHPEPELPYAMPRAWQPPPQSNEITLRRSAEIVRMPARRQAR